MVSSALLAPARTVRPVALAAGGMISLAAAVGIGRFVYTPILPVMAEALALSRAQAGLIASANFMGYLLGALLAATPALPGTRRAWLLGALLVNAASAAAMGATSVLALFLLLRFLGGAASAFALILASALVLERLAGRGRSGLSALHFAGVGVGITCSALLVSALLAWGADWRRLWFFVGAVALISTVAVAGLIPPEHRLPTQPIARREHPHRHGLAQLIFAYGLFGFGYVITATFLLAIVRANPAAHVIEPWIWLVVGLTAAPSVVGWMNVSSRLGIRHAFSLACLIEAIGVIASVLWPTATGALLAAVLLGGTFMGLTALGLAEARVLAPVDPRPAFALMTAAFGVGQIVGPSLAGILADRIGGFGVPSMLAAAALILAAFVMQTIRPVRAG